MKMKKNLLKLVSELFDSQLVAVLSTTKDDKPYSCLVSYVVDEEIGNVIFSTRRKRLKYRNMRSNPFVCLMVDNRQNEPSDIHRATSVTIIGEAFDTEGNEREKCMKLLLGRHSNLTEFVNHPDTAVIKVAIEKMYVVSDFESVNVIEV
ncbi:MAG: pyridoxamine 5'-phosphate oxidase family protein [Candidatus Lokiarchaeota archaeon]|nr:pyridoxamine 5'-phosphate oxidase family protein [Candidatus Lokiarchaeota archaeon]